MKKIKVNKKILAILLATGIGVGAVSFSLSRKQQDTIEDKPENGYGYTEINPIYNWKIDPEDFVILDIGDHNSIGTRFQNKKMKMCNEQDISLGVVISSDAETEADIYDDVLYAKSIIKNYKVDMPVFLNVDKIVQNKNLNSEQKEKLINDFLRKCYKNHIVAGINGLDSNLCRLAKFCKIDSCKVYLTMDHESISYDGEIDILDDYDRELETTYHYFTSQSEDKMNDAKYFVNDRSYIVKSDDDILDIALEADMSVSDLLKYNNMKEKDIKEGAILKIPSKSEIRQFKGLEDFEILDEAIRGCDLSLNQGTEINWDKLASNFDFAILKCSNGLEVDPTFEDNAVNCSLYNIPIGVYCYNTVDNSDMPDLKLFEKRENVQIDYVLTLLEGKNISYPVYLNLAYSEGINEHFTKTQVNKMIELWSNRIREAGFIPGVYCNQYDYQFLQSCVDYPVSDVLQVWISGGDQYSSQEGAIELDDVVPTTVLTDKKFNAGVAQSTNVCVNAGAGDAFGYLDVNYSIVDYTRIPAIENSEEYEEKEFKRPDWLLLGGGLGIVVLINSSLALNGTIQNMKTNSKKKNATK